MKDLIVLAEQPRRRKNNVCQFKCSLNRSEHKDVSSKMMLSFQMHQVASISLLLLASVVARTVITSVLVPPDGIKGNLQTFVQSVSCEYTCEGSEDKNGREMLWLWRSEGNCGILCSILNEIGAGPPNSTGSALAESTGTSQDPVSGINEVRYLN